MCCTAVNKNLSVSEMAEKGRRSYFNDDYLNTKEVQKEKQLRKVQEKLDTGQPRRTPAASATGERRSASCLNVSAFRQMVRNNFFHRHLNPSSLPATKRADRNRSLPCSPARQGPTGFSCAASEATVVTPGWC